MTEPQDFNTFFEENTKLAREYLETKTEVWRLRLIRLFARTSGKFLWIIISLILFALFVVFAGLTIGFWLSALLGSYAKGFAVTTAFILLVTAILALLRKTLFINPIIRATIHHATSEEDKTNVD